MHYLVPSDYTLKLYEHLKPHIKELMWIDPLKASPLKSEDVIMVDDHQSQVIENVLTNRFTGKVIVFSSANTSKDSYRYINKYRSVEAVIRDIIEDSKKWIVITGTSKNTTLSHFTTESATQTLFIDTLFSPECKFNLFRDSQKNILSYCINNNISIISNMLDAINPPTEVLEKLFLNLWQTHHLVFFCLPIKGPLDGLILSKASHIISIHSEHTTTTDIFDKQISNNYGEAQHQVCYLNQTNLSDLLKQLTTIELLYEN